MTENHWRYAKISFVLIAWVMASGISGMAAGCAVEAGLRVAAVGIEAAAPHAKRAFEKVKESFSGDAKDPDKEKPKSAGVEPRNDQSMPDADHPSLNNQSSPTVAPKKLSADLCSQALKTQTPKWDTRSIYREYVDEAKQLGLTEAQCARLTGGYTEVQIAAVNSGARKFSPREPSPTVTEEPNKKRVLSEKNSCPLPYNSNTWSGCYGTFTDVDGHKYTGEFEKGKPHGQGIYAYSDGNVYKGGFKDGKPHGKGKYTNVDGTIDEVRWLNGVLILSEQTVVP